MKRRGALKMSLCLNLRLIAQNKLLMGKIFMLTSSQKLRHIYDHLHLTMLFITAIKEQL